MTTITLGDLEPYLLITYLTIARKHLETINGDDDIHIINTLIHKIEAAIQ